MRSVLPLFAFGIAVAAPAAAAEVIPVPEFRSVQLQGGGTVTIRPGGSQRVTLLTGSSQLTRFHVRRNGKLDILACDNNCPRNYRLEILIETPRLPDVAITGGGTISAAPGFAAQDQISAAITGGGSIDVRSVPARVVSAAVSGGGQIRVQPRDVLSGVVSGGGAIRYWGNPRVSSVVNGGGTVQRGN